MNFCLHQNAQCKRNFYNITICITCLLKRKTISKYSKFFHFNYLLLILTLNKKGVLNELKKYGLGECHIFQFLVIDVQYEIIDSKITYNYVMYWHFSTLLLKLERLAIMFNRLSDLTSLNYSLFAFIYNQHSRNAIYLKPSFVLFAII